MPKPKTIQEVTPEKKEKAQVEQKKDTHKRETREERQKKERLK
jgi:hypothetical protein